MATTVNRLPQQPQELGRVQATTAAEEATTGALGVGGIAVAALDPAAQVGARSFVTNATTPVFGSAVVGGGAVAVPVYFDGTVWKVG